MRRVRLALCSAILCLAPSACGLLSHESDLVAFPPDGINDFGDAEPIEVCLGSAKVIPPSQAQGLGGSLCVSTSSKTESCTSDAMCDGIEKCFCGRCIVEACTGSSCPGGSLCRDNRCTKGCATDADCDGETCAIGGCARACSNDDQCHRGEYCDFDGVCKTHLCSAQVPCGADETCEAEEQTATLHEPDLATISGQSMAFVEIDVAGSPVSKAILRTRIDSATSFAADPPKPVLGGEGDSVGAPSALVSGNQVELYFEIGDGTAIGHAVSSDGGASFTRDATHVLDPEVEWEKGSVGSPSIVEFEGQTLLFYEGGPRAGIGVARVVNGKATRLSKVPIVTPATAAAPPFWRDMTDVRAPYAVVDGPVLRVYFTGRGIDGSDAIVDDASVPAPPNDAIGLVATRDLETWDVSPTGPVYSRVTNLRAYLGQSEAAIELDPNGATGAEIVFVGADATGAAPTGLFHAGTQ